MGCRKMGSSWVWLLLLAGRVKHLLLVWILRFSASTSFCLFLEEGLRLETSAIYLCPLKTLKRPADFLQYFVPLIESFKVTTSSPVVKVPMGEAADLYCSYTADFGQPRVEWKFKDLMESTTLVYYEGTITATYQDRVKFSPAALHFSKTLSTDSGVYTCEVTATDRIHAGAISVELIVQVSPDVPMAHVPTSVTTGSSVELRCSENQGYPPSTYVWYRNMVLMPEKPASSASFRNSTYTFNPSTGVLTFNPVSRSDAGEYICEASNGVGQPMKSDPPVFMEVYDTNVGGIVAGVIIALIILALIGIGVWFAYRKGYIGQKTSAKPKVIYSQPVGDVADNGDFKQKSSFVV